MTAEEEEERVYQGLEMAYAGLAQAVAWMPHGCLEARALAPLIKDLKRVLKAAN